MQFNKLTKAVLLLLPVFIFLMGCGNTKAGSDITDGLIYDENDNTWSSGKEDFQPLVAVMKRECSKSDEIKGTYLLATDDEVIFIGGIGSVETDGKTKVNAYTTYEIGSVTKTFTATAVLKLIEEGKIRLDDKVTDYFPEYEKAKDITIYHLLHMQSGIVREFIPDDTYQADIEVWKKYYNDGYSDEQMLEMLYEQDLLFEPGSEYFYSNVNYSLLTMIIEKVTGESYCEYVKKNIFEPCGMDHSSSMTFGDVTSVPEPVPEGYYPFDVTEIVPTGYINTPNSWRGTGDIHSCASDMLAFDRALLGEKIINSDSLKTMFDMDKGYGCGWQTFSRPGFDGLYYHPGGTPSYIAANMCYTGTSYGNIYFIYLKPTVLGGESDGECIENLFTVLKLNVL